MERALSGITLLSIFLAAPAVAGTLPDELTLSVGGYRQHLVKRRAYVPVARPARVMGSPVLQLDQPELPAFPELLLIVTNQRIADDSSALSEYIAWRRAQGWRVLVATESQWDQPAPRDWDDRPARIREFLRQIYQREGPGYLLLIGDPDPDGDGIPMRRTEPLAHLLPYFPTSLAESLSGVGTDHYYADLGSDWDCDGDGIFAEYPDDAGAECADWGPELIVGRIPVYRGVTDLDAILHAIIDYDTAESASTRDTALFAGAFGGFRGQLSPGGDGSTYPEDDDLASFLARAAEDLPAGVEAVRLFEDDGIVTSEYAHEGALSYSALLEAWQAGAGTVSWGGHGSEVSSHRMIWREDDGNDAADFDEVESPAFVSSDAAEHLAGAPLAVVHMMSCLNGTPEHPHNLGASLLGAGAIATASASRSAVGESEPGWVPKPELASATTGSYYFTLLVQEGHRVGDALAYTKWGLPSDGWDVYEGEPGAELLNAYGWLTKLEYNLYGDPTVSLRRCAIGGDCDDGSACSGAESCVDGYCTHADAVLCTDEPSGPCLTPTCDPDTGGCTEVPVLDGTPCDDGLYCTIDNVCSGGACVGESRACATASGYLTECSEETRDCLLTPEVAAEDGCTQTRQAPLTILAVSFLLIIIISRRSRSAGGERP